MDNANNGYARAAEQLAGFGRGGDSMLMHVNPIEVDALNRAMPGRITKNPVTGQPEGFAFLAPLLIGALLGGVSGGVSAKSRGIPLWKGILMGAGLGAVGSGITAGAAGLLAPAATAGGGAIAGGGAAGGGAAGAGAGAGAAGAGGAGLLAPVTGQLPTGAAGIGSATVPNIANQLAQLGVSEGANILGQGSLGALTSSPTSLVSTASQVPTISSVVTPSSSLFKLTPMSSAASTSSTMPSTMASASTPALEQGLGATAEKSFLSEMIENQFTKPTKHTLDGGEIIDSTVGRDAVRSYIGNPIHPGVAIMAPQLLLPYGEEEEEEHDWGIPGWIGRGERRTRPADWGSSQFDYYGE